MVALIIYLVVGLVVMVIGWPIYVIIRAYRKCRYFDLYLDIGLEALHKYDLGISQNMNRFKRHILMILWNVVWPYKLYRFNKDLIPIMDKAYMNELEQMFIQTIKEEL